MQQFLVPGYGFLFCEGGLSLAEAAAICCWRAGALSDADFEDRGVPALRRHLYAITCQGMIPVGHRDHARKGPKEEADTG